VKKLVVPALIILVLAVLTACQPTSAAVPPPPSPIPTVTFTPLPPEPTAVPTSTPILPLNSPNGPPLRSIHMFTLKDGWGLIDDALLVTHDSGVTWASVPLPGGKVDSSTEAVFLNLNVAYLVVPSPDGQSGQLFITNNGGANWDLYPVPFLRGRLVFIGSIGYFLETGGASGKEVSIYNTSDGINWAKTVAISLPDAKLITGFSFNSVERGWLGIASQPQKVVLYQTNTAAQTWVEQDIPAPENIASLTTSAFPPVFIQGNTANGFLPVDFTSTETGDRNRLFYITTDGGSTWTPGGSVPDGGAYTFANANTGWAWGKRGLYGTTDGAQTWMLLPGGFNRSEHASWINFIDAQNGWLITVGQNSRVRLYRTTDGGNTWLVTAP
jgi:photosystem II stability/assembly factor-like uncharacterized protein